MISRVYTTAAYPLAAAFCLLGPSIAHALLTGGVGSAPLPDPGWPSGAAQVFNHPSRIAYWVGPPFGGGQYHAECRGTTAEFNAVLELFAKSGVADKRLVVVDGVGSSFWLNPNKTEEKRDQAEIDWSFMVWNPEKWERLSKLPAAYRPTDTEQQNPPTEIRLNAGGQVRWEGVREPDGVTVIDNRLGAHGHTAADGVVVQGTLTDGSTGKAVSGSIELQSVARRRTDGPAHSLLTKTTTDDAGNWVFKNTPKGRCRVVASAPGYASRVIGHLVTTGQPRYLRLDSVLTRSTEVAGQVTDGQGAPLSGVRVRATSVVAEGQRYEVPQRLETLTDARGEFKLSGVASGEVTLGCYKEGYVRPGVGLVVRVPAEAPVALSMSPSAELVVKVRFASDERPAEYLVKVAPEGGNAVGAWGGSAKVDQDGLVVFRNIPPGKYVLVGRPNPASEDETTRPVTIDLTDGKRREYTLNAK